MRRIVDHYLQEWKEDSYRKPLILRGCRQVGKTHVVRKLSESFEDYVEINLEEQTQLHSIFEKDLDPDRILRDLSLALDRPISPDNTLIFFDEIQAVPRALIALRYFYEKRPEVFVIAAGSLLEFAIEEVGVPVGRVTFLHLYPMNFLEFLVAGGHWRLAQLILEHSLDEELSSVIHGKIHSLLGQYLAVGGMPEAVNAWVEREDLFACQQIREALIQSYIQDFPKYARRAQIKYVDLLFQYIPHCLGEKFKYQNVPGDYRKRELEPALELLHRAKVVHRIFHTAAHGVPLGGQISFKHFKVIGVDIGLMQSLLGHNTSSWILDFDNACINKGEIIEAFVGQEIMAYEPPQGPRSLYYWMSDKRGQVAEVDYVVAQGPQVIPIEVKSGKSRRLKSLKAFLALHPNTPYGVHIAPQPFNTQSPIYQYPLYAVSKLQTDPQHLEILHQFCSGD